MTQAGSLGQPRGMLNFHWVTGSRFQSSRMLNCHWWKTGAASPYADVAVTSSEGCERRLGVAYSLDFLKGQGRSGHRGIEWEEERGHAPRSDTFPTVVGPHHPLVRPHAIPGV